MTKGLSPTQRTQVRTECKSDRLRHKYENVCNACGCKFNPHRRKQKFCSRACAVTGRSGCRRKRLIKATCRRCSRRYLIKQSITNKTKFCSRICMLKSRIETGKYSGSKNPNWRGGKSFEPYSTEFTERLKEVIRKRFRRRCQFCGRHERTSDRKLDVHHVDYDKTNCSESNLIPLCRACNSLANYYNRRIWTMIYREKLRLMMESR